MAQARPGRAALLVLVYLHKDDPFAELGAGCRGVDHDLLADVYETVEMRAARTPKLRTANGRAKPLLADRLAVAVEATPTA